MGGRAAGVRRARGRVNERGEQSAHTPPDARGSPSRHPAIPTMASMDEHGMERVLLKGPEVGGQRGRRGVGGVAGGQPRSRRIDAPEVVA